MYIQLLLAEPVRTRVLPLPPRHRRTGRHFRSHPMGPDTRLHRRLCVERLWCVTQLPLLFLFPLRLPSLEALSRDQRRADVALVPPLPVSFSPNVAISRRQLPRRDQARGLSGIPGSLPCSPPLPPPSLDHNAVLRRRRESQQGSYPGPAGGSH